MLIEYLQHADEVYVVLLRAGYQSKSVDFFTEDENEIQMGMFLRKKGYTVEPHKHVCQPFQLTTMQEYILVRFGQLKMDFFTDAGKLYNSVILNTGDSVLTMKGGHSITFLEESSILEIKQGPYAENKKVFFDSQSSH